MIIRQEKTEDYDTVRKIYSIAFKQADEAELVTKLRSNPVFIPELSLVAEKNNEVIGHILFTPICIVDGNKQHKSLALAPMAVLPEQQRKGVGSALINKGLTKAQDMGFSSVIVLGHPNYYSRFGFLSAEDFEIYPRLPEWREAFFVKELKKGALDEVAGTVSYPPEFGL